MNFKFILHDQPNSLGEHPIYLRVSSGKKRIKIRTEKKILAKFWNPTQGRIKNTNAYPLHSEVNNQLTQLESKALLLYNRFKSEYQKDPDLSYLKKLVEFEVYGSKNPDEKFNLLSYYKDYCERLVDKTNPTTGKPLTKSFISTNFQSQRKLEAFLMESKLPYQFEDIDKNFYEAYVKYLQRFNYTSNYIGKQIKHIKSVLNEATIAGINTNVQFKGFRVFEEDSVKLVLREEEIKEMFELDLSKERKTLGEARDLFVFASWTGLRFGDIKEFSKKARIEDDLIFIRTQKSNKDVAIPLHPMAKGILKKYKGQLPSPPNHKYNQRIKEIAALMPSMQKPYHSEVTRGGKLTILNNPKFEYIQSHTARRSYATNMTIRGFAAESIMAITGHSKVSTFRKYIQLPQMHHARLIADAFKNEE